MREKEHRLQNHVQHNKPKLLILKIHPEATLKLHLMPEHCG